VAKQPVAKSNTVQYTKKPNVVPQQKTA